ncbi:MAG: DUF4270 domain-containing protein [Chitinophaga sp.]|uniref:DUF4270 family protein n=1 Tax=Chitinophaga sp. TaxID=1869181 RepID=UPI0025B90C82|nr:DUF4270 family protein [Chitinophaga sp.]MBV8253765.1 DUF4270 domain-containing protein [Chitinophaga sp.]
MKIKLRNLSYVAAIVSVLYASSGCNQATLLGTNLIPPGDLVNSQDSIVSNIITRNVSKYDSTIINNFNSYTHILGSITADPVFGKTHAFLFMQVGLPQSAFTFQGTNQTLDSVVLSLSYSGYTGDSTTPQTFNVYRMNEPGFKIDSNYAYNKVLGYNPGELLGTATVTPLSARDSVNVLGTMEAAQIRIKLSSAFGNLLLQQKSDGAFATDSSFRDFLKGFAIIPDTMAANHKNMLYVNMNSVNTKLTVFYKANGKDSTMRTAFGFSGSTSGHATTFLRNYNGSEAGNYINTNNPKGDSILFLQAAPGLFTKVTIPNLENFPNVIINSAELIITQITVGESDKNNIFIEPSSLTLRQYTNGDSTKVPIDAGSTTFYTAPKQIVTNFGGVMVAQYKFSLNHYMAQLIKKNETNNGFKLEGFSSLMMDVPRVKAGGGNHSQYSLKLRVIYTKP